MIHCCIGDKANPNVGLFIVAASDIWPHIGVISDLPRS
jgi:hypothetical protein